MTKTGPVKSKSGAVILGVTNSLIVSICYRDFATASVGDEGRYAVLFLALAGQKHHRLGKWTNGCVGRMRG